MNNSNDEFTRPLQLTGQIHPLRSRPRSWNGSNFHVAIHFQFTEEEGSRGWSETSDL